MNPPERSASLSEAIGPCHPELHPEALLSEPGLWGLLQAVAITVLQMSAL